MLSRSSIFIQATDTRPEVKFEDLTLCSTMKFKMLSRDRRINWIIDGVEYSYLRVRKFARRLNRWRLHQNLEMLGFRSTMIVIDDEGRRWQIYQPSNYKVDGNNIKEKVENLCKVLYQ